MPKNLVNIKAEIIQTTRKMILEKGYENLNIRDIAKRCGIATGTFYNYFRSKQEIVSSLLDADWKAFRLSILRQTNTDQPPMGQLELMYVNLKEMIADIHSIWAAGFPEDLESGTMSKLQRIKKDLRAEFSQHITEVIRGHVEAEQEAFIADFIARVFFSYAYEAQTGFDALRPVLEKILH